MSLASKLQRYDKVPYGIITALVLLVVGFFFSYLIVASGTDTTFSQYIGIVKHSSNRMNVMILSMIPNMFLFYFANFQWRLYHFVRGLVGVSIIFCIIIVFMSL